MRLAPAVLFGFGVAALACDGTSQTEHGADAAASHDAAASPCPVDPPVAGIACTDIVPAGTECAYERCGDVGLVQARCDATAWKVSTTVCSEHTCQGQACGSGTVCAAQASGALIVDCRPHACANGPLDCACVCGAGVECTRGDASGGDALFTCYVGCGAEICP